MFKATPEITSSCFVGVSFEEEEVVEEEEDGDEDEEELDEEAAVGGCLGLVGALRSCIGSYSTPVFGSLIIRTLLGCGIGVLCKGIDLGGPAIGIPWGFIGIWCIGLCIGI